MGAQQIRRRASLPAQKLRKKQWAMATSAITAHTDANSKAVRVRDPLLIQALLCIRSFGGTSGIPRHARVSIANARSYFAQLPTKLHRV